MALLRVVLDTNVLVSGIVYPGSIPGRIIALWYQGGLKVVLSHYILDETVRVLPRLSRSGLTASDARGLVETIVFLADLVEPDLSSEPGLRDAADQQILGTFKAAGADYLITGDKDLLVLSENYPIISPAHFWSRHS